MKLKNLFALLVACAMLTGLTATVFADDADEEDSKDPLLLAAEAVAVQYVEDNAANWADSNWIRFYDRTGAHAGFDFIVADFIEAVEENFGRSTEGGYRFTYVVSGGREVMPHTYKVVTTDGDTSALAHIRFTDWFKPEHLDQVAIITYNDDRVGGRNAANTPTTGLIPAELLVEIGSYDQKLRFSTQDNVENFILHEVVAEHFPDGLDGEGTVVFRLSTDEFYQSLNLGTEFNEGPMGTMVAGTSGAVLSPEGVPLTFNDDDEPIKPFMMVNAGNLDPDVYIESEEGDEDAGDDGTDEEDDGADNENNSPEEPADDAMSGGGAGAEADDEGSFPIGIVIGGGAAIVAIAGTAAAIGLRKNKK